MIRAAFVAAIVLTSIVPSGIVLTATDARADERGYDLRNAELKKPAPLVVVLHCYGCAPQQLPPQLGIDALAKKYGFVVAVPAGRVDSAGRPFWNATPACCDFEGAKPDDVGYVLGVIDELVKKRIADPKRVYLVGFSNGGFLAYRLACEHADKIAAIVSMGGGAPESCAPSSALSVLDVHGQADEVVPVGGRALGRGFPRRGGFPPADAALARFAAADQCSRADGADDAKRGGDDAKRGIDKGRRAWRCPRNAVELWMMPGGHVASYGDGFGERVWKWLAARHK
ncbi:MAG: hypothetical protein JWN44_4817 [Myxococcales bacterium]|nr:hypothetical protein [Myxococcales bacterium]